MIKLSKHKTLQITGSSTREEIYQKSLPHGAVQLLLRIKIKNHPPKLLLHLRSKNKRTSPEKWDICGGHLEAEETWLLSQQKNWSDQKFIAKLYWETALRELREEIILKNYIFKKEDLKLVGEIGAFETGFNPPTRNREYSSLFFAKFPFELAADENIGEHIEMWDTVNINGEKAEEKITNFRLVNLDELKQEFKNPEKRDDFADGIGRILLKLETDSNFYKILKYEMETW